MLKKFQSERKNQFEMLKAIQSQKYRVNVLNRTQATMSPRWTMLWRLAANDDSNDNDASLLRSLAYWLLAITYALWMFCVFLYFVFV